MYKSYTMELAGRTLRVDIGRVAAQANGAAFMHYGDTVVLSTATASDKPKILGISQISLQRQALTQIQRQWMIDDCEAENIDMIITKSISRFARNTLDCLKYIRQLKDKNIPVFFEKEAINTMDAKGEVLITIMAFLAQQES